jgi:PAS domain S-box-containing protein
MSEMISILELYILLTVAWAYILIYSVFQYRSSKNGPLLIRSMYLIIALFSFRFFSAYAINLLHDAQKQALFDEKMSAILTSFYHSMTLDMIDSIVTFAILIIIVLGFFGRQRIQLQNELDQFFRLKSDARRMKEDVHRKRDYIALLETVSAIKKLLIESSTQDEILTYVCALLGKVPHYKVVWIGLQRDENPIIDIAYRVDLVTPPYLTKDFYVTLDESDAHAYGPVGECMRTGKSVLIEDTQSDPRFEAWKYPAKASGLHSVLSLPMKIFNREKLFGVITIYSDAEHQFVNEELRILEDLIQNVSSAIAYHEANNRRKESEHELRNTVALLENIISTAPVRIFWKDRELRYLGCNNHFLHDAGLAHIDQLIGKKDTELVWAEHADEYNRDDRQVLQTENPVVNRVEREREMWLLTNKAPLYDEEHKVIGVVGSYIDITLQRRAELYLKENEQRFRELMNVLPNISIQGYDKDRKVIYWNRQSEVLYGYSEKEARGRRLEELVIPDDMRDQTITDIDNWVHNNIVIPPSELVLRKKDGSEVLVYSSHVMLRSQDDEPEIFRSIKPSVTRVRLRSCLWTWTTLRSMVMRTETSFWKR